MPPLHAPLECLRDGVCLRVSPGNGACPIHVGPAAAGASGCDAAVASCPACSPHCSCGGRRGTIASSELAARLHPACSHSPSLGDCLSASLGDCSRRPRSHAAALPRHWPWPWPCALGRVCSAADGCGSPPVHITAASACCSLPQSSAFLPLAAACIGRVQRPRHTASRQCSCAPSVSASGGPLSSSRTGAWSSTSGREGAAMLCAACCWETPHETSSCRGFQP